MASTPRFRDLTPTAAASVVSAFLGGKSDVEFTEKLAGQHLTAELRPDGWFFSIKTGERGGGFFPDVEDTLEEFHPKAKPGLAYQFEIVNRRDRPDYIDYDLKNNAAVEYTGAMTPAVAKVLNSKQKSVTFLTKQDISKPVGGLVTDAKTKAMLKSFVAAAKKGERIPKERMLEVEEVLMGLIDAGEVPSSLGGPRIEGLFGTAGGKGFKIPSKAYADLQIQQARFYALIRSGKSWQVYDRFDAAVADPSSDKVVSDILDYFDKMAAGGPGPGFRVFFSPTEAKGLKKLADKYRRGDAASGRELAEALFDRIQDRDSWASTSSRKGRGIKAENSTIPYTVEYSTNILLRRLIREHLRR